MASTWESMPYDLNPLLVAQLSSAGLPISHTGTPHSSFLYVTTCSEYAVLRKFSKERAVLHSPAHAWTIFGGTVRARMLARQAYVERGTPWTINSYVSVSWSVSFLYLPGLSLRRTNHLHAGSSSV